MSQRLRERMYKPLMSTGKLPSFLAGHENTAVTAPCPSTRLLARRRAFPRSCTPGNGQLQEQQIKCCGYLFTAAKEEVGVVRHGLV